MNAYIKNDQKPPNNEVLGENKFPDKKEPIDLFPPDHQNSSSKKEGSRKRHDVVLNTIFSHFRKIPMKSLIKLFERKEYNNKNVQSLKKCYIKVYILLTRPANCDEQTLEDFYKF